MVPPVKKDVNDGKDDDDGLRTVCMRERARRKVGLSMIAGE